MSDNNDFPNIIYRRGASGILTPVLRGTGIRAQTIAIASQEQTPAEIAEDYNLTEVQVQEALAFYKVNRAKIDAYIQEEAALVPKMFQTL